jgi:16S rRNA (adenine1518-N6/adenine1519-N6)-dimethyltransferase
MPVYPYPQKRFGQNFLTNKHYAAKIVDSIKLSEHDTILEIGPGRGALTELINEQKAKKKLAVEIDPQLFEQLRKNYGEVEIIQNDILSFSFEGLYKQSNSKIKVVGNIPYNITSPILFHLLDNSSYISQAVLMIQKEVAERLIAQKDTKEYGILSILVNAQAQVLKLFVVDRKNFYPQPKVDSMVIKLEFLKSQSELENYELFKQIVKSTFNNRRKMIKNSLKKIVNEQELGKIKSVALNLRPENLSIIDFSNLTNEIEQIRK